MLFRMRYYAAHEQTNLEVALVVRVGLHCRVASMVDVAAGDHDSRGTGSNESDGSKGEEVHGVRVEVLGGVRSKKEP